MPLGHDPGARIGEQRREFRIRRFQREMEGQVAVRFDLRDLRHQPFDRRHRVGAEMAPDAVDGILCRQRLAVVEGDAFAERETPFGGNPASRVRWFPRGKAAPRASRPGKRDCCRSASPGAVDIAGAADRIERVRRSCRLNAMRAVPPRLGAAVPGLRGSDSRREIDAMPAEPARKRRRVDFRLIEAPRRVMAGSHSLKG